MTWTETAARVVAAAVIGALIGLNRDLQGKPIGVRTLGVVAIACCTLTLATLQFGESEGHSADAVSRAIQGLMAGIGFLGGGVILRRAPHHVEGLTTAALVWLTATLGVACGMGAWRTTIVAAVSTWALLLLGTLVERRLHVSEHK